MPEESGLLLRPVHVEWGAAALAQASERGDGVVIVDVMSFSTLVALVTERGAIVRSLAPDAVAMLGGRAAVAERFDAHLAGERRDDPTARVTLSPASAARVEPGDRLVVVSPNGARLTAGATGAAFAVVGSLRNCVAVAHFCAAALSIGLVDRVTIVAAGEQWKDDGRGGRARFAIEDWLGAGAIASECAASVGAVDAPDRASLLSAEADVAARAFVTLGTDVGALLAASVSGRELATAGHEADVVLATAVGVDDGVPVLRSDGFVARLAFTMRPARESDRGFLFALKRDTMRDYVVAAFGAWTDGDQRANHGPDLARIAIVAVDGRDVAMVEARVEDGAFCLANFQVTPDRQSQGLGSEIVELLAATAHARGRALRLRVLKVNHRAQKFYERLGMSVIGELPRHWSMALPPAANRRTADSSPR